MIAATKHRHQPAQRLGGSHLPTTNRKLGATSDPGQRNHCLQNDGKPDEPLGVRVGTWNVGSISGRGTEVCEKLQEEDGCVLSARSELERTRHTGYGCEGQKIQVVVVLE